MDGSRIDDLVRFLTTRGSRRRLVAGLAAVPGAMPAADAAAARKKGERKRKKGCRCRICRRCQGGACVRAPDGTECGDCGICASGFCVPKVNQATCDLCTTCEAGMCVNRPLGFPCSALGQCDGGECIFPPGCGAFNTDCSLGPCCGACCEVLGYRYCCRSEPGDACYDDDDCVEGASCIAYRCRA